MKSACGCFFVLFLLLLLLFKYNTFINTLEFSYMLTVYFENIVLCL